MNQRTVRYATLGLVSIGVLLIARRVQGFLASRRTYLPEQVAEKLPVAKDLQTIPDRSGNYDIDGVSFDDEGVIISGDATKPIPSLI